MTKADNTAEPKKLKEHRDFRFSGTDILEEDLQKNAKKTFFLNLLPNILLAVLIFDTSF